MLFSKNNLKRSRFFVLTVCSLFIVGCGEDKDITSPIFQIPTGTLKNNIVKDDLGDEVVIEADATKLADRQEIRIGIMLPLSGKSKYIGNAIFNAATMALYDSKDQRLKIISADTEGTPEGAVSAMNKMIEERADIIIGPLFSSSITAIKPLISESGINIIALSTDETVAGGGVYLLNFRPDEQIKRIVDYAAKNGHDSFAALLPMTAYGKIAKKSLLETTLELEKSVINMAFYPTSEVLTDLMPPVRKIANYKARHQALLDEREFLESFGEDDDMAQEFLKDVKNQDTIGNVNFSAILLPDGGQMLKIMAPLLSFFDINTDKIQVIGTGLWDDKDLLSEPQLEGAWYAAPKRKIAHQFLKRYKEHFRETAPRLATLGYDAFALLASMTRSLATPNFTDQALTKEEGFSGLDGIFRFKNTGLSERGLAIYKISSGRFIMIEDAPAYFNGSISEKDDNLFILKPVFSQEYDLIKARPSLKASRIAKIE